MIAFARDDDSPPPLTDEQQRLFDDHVSNVEWLAWKRATRWVSYEDQLQNGLVGLLNAARGFEPERGLKFWTYAYILVLGAMIDAEREGAGGVIRIPRSARRERTTEEWSHFQSARFGEMERNYREAGGRHPSGLAVDCADESPIDAEALWKAVSGLGKRPALALLMYYRMRMTMREIGENLGLSESRVSQMCSTAMEDLRSNPRVLAAAGQTKGATA